MSIHTTVTIDGVGADAKALCNHLVARLARVGVAA